MLSLVTFFSGPLGRFVGIGLLCLAVAGSAVVWHTRQLDRAFDRGVTHERAEQADARAKLQAEHDARVAAIQHRINAISRQADLDRVDRDIRIAKLNLEIARTSDEDFLCPAGQPVFSDGLLGRLNALGGG